MKCEIDLSWRNDSEDMALSRTKRPEEIWATPGSSRNLHQMIAVLDMTYQDTRAALISMLPVAEQDNVDVVWHMNTAQYKEFRKFMEGGD